ncbi:hypothetical protein ElyMa_003245000 [Elysia marginata]|uniref:BRCT domain-containing protein n=1 Tax=Elysia marginata TaxID=1093978 RepID=A0AAV4J5K3_9GAST|nr:hypothetical protein ElyMa_003245000 [Elysia marginata]
MTKQVRKVPSLATRCVCPIGYMGLTRGINLLVTKPAREKTVSLLSMHCVCVRPIDYGPCRSDELASVIKDTGGVHRVKQSVLVSASEVLRCDKTSERKDKP